MTATKTRHVTPRTAAGTHSRRNSNAIATGPHEAGNNDQPDGGSFRADHG